LSRSGAAEVLPCTVHFRTDALAGLVHQFSIVFAKLQEQQLTRLE
jgi:hypothetical protein